MADTPAEVKTLETERLLLEPLLPEHATLLFEGLADERLYRFIPSDPPECLEALESRYRMLSSRRSPDGSEAWLNFAMRLREEGTRPKATYVGTLEATVFPERCAYLAYTVFFQFWRRGYAREGCARMLTHLLEEQGVRVVAAEMDTRNAASIALVESLGFERVGTTPGADHFKGSVSDEHRYELPAYAQLPRADFFTKCLIRRAILVLRAAPPLRVSTYAASVKASAVERRVS